MLWEIQETNEHIIFGNKKIKLITECCNFPYLNKFYCPGRKWFMSTPCCFLSKAECDTFKRMCGNI
jgi:hypothetical protein